MCIINVCIPQRFNSVFNFVYNIYARRGNACALMVWTSLSFPLFYSSDCNSTIQLKAGSGVQGTLKTPFFPSYYPPNTNCTWTFTVSDNSTSSTENESSHKVSECCSFKHKVFCLLDAQFWDRFGSGVWGLRAEQSRLQPGLYPGSVDHPEQKVNLH